MLTHALGLLCVLATSVFAAATTRRWQHLAAAPVGFAVAVLWLPPAPAVAGGLAALVALGQLVRPGWSGAGMAGAGALAGLWAVWLRTLGWPMVPAMVVSAAVPAASVWFSQRRAGFAPTRVREEALLAVGVLGLVVAASPVVMAGWGTATALNPVSAGPGTQQAAAWLFVTGGGVMVLGGVHSLWRRR